MTSAPDRDHRGISHLSVASNGAQRRAAPDYAFRGPEIRRLTAEQFADFIGAITGEWHVYQPPNPKPDNPPPPQVYTRNGG